jgi:hypothetical protein
MPEFMSEPSLATQAFAQALAEMRAAGDLPRLSALIAVLPDATDALADATIAEFAESDERPDALSAEQRDTPGEVTDTHLSPGTQRGVTAIFGAGDIAPIAAGRAPGGRDDAVALVAEAPALYSATTGAAGGLLALAQQQGLDAETLAARIMLAPDALHWLDRVALPPERQPDALLAHLVGALGVERERVRAALGRGAAARDTAAETTDLIGILSATESMTPAQRSYWSALLSSSV